MAAVSGLHATGRLPAPEDNVAIAIRQLEPGTVIELDGRPRVLRHTVLEGHRFAVRPIKPGEPLLSWGLPFGRALAAIAPGEYVCNHSILESLAARRLGITLPAGPNFEDQLVPFEIDEAAFVPGQGVAPTSHPRSFQGYRRPGSRGVGTRNMIVILGTTSRTAGFVRQLAARLQPYARLFPRLDGIVAVTHTEGGGSHEPNNAPEVLRTLAGFMVHPNVGAVLAVDHGTEPVSNSRLREFMATCRYPLADVPHGFLSIRGGLSAALEEGASLIRRWLPIVGTLARTPESLSALRVALQCGGSDAFSGVSGNPLAGAVAHEIIRHGGIGVLCETDEVAGAEAYLMRNIRDLSTARALLGKIAGFREQLAWHGITPESNPSAGNKLRGLYNITLKSLGAVHKKDPRTRVDYVIDYAEPVSLPGFYFMNSPGNDLEGIAGQVGAGCNLILFVTGNGSITNFPFVPTIKITTTTRRHQLLTQEMDFNAGRYLDGEPMALLTEESVDLLVATASGRKTRGEQAGHAQTSLWRNWRQTDSSRVEFISARPAPDGRAIRTATNFKPADTATVPLELFPLNGSFATERVGLVLPTSMCAAQIARLAVERLNANKSATYSSITRFVSLAHTEGCGYGGDTLHQLLQRTYRGYATHPNVVAALLIEHGCEKILNDTMRRHFESEGLPSARFGWASVQLDGGIERSIRNIEGWFHRTLPTLPASTRIPAALGALRVGLLSTAVDDAGADAFARVARAILGGGGSVLIPESDPLLAHEIFRAGILGTDTPRASLAYGQPLTTTGLHIVATDTDHWVENLAGLGGCGVHLFLGLVGDSPQQGHPLLPVLQVARPGTMTSDVDMTLGGDPLVDETTLFRHLRGIVSGRAVAIASADGFVDFQLSRGLLGVST